MRCCFFISGLVIGFEGPSQMILFFLACGLGTMQNLLEIGYIIKTDDFSVPNIHKTPTARGMRSPGRAVMGRLQPVTPRQRQPAMANKASIMRAFAHSERLGMGLDGVGEAKGTATALGADMDVPPASVADTVQV